MKIIVKIFSFDDFLKFPRDSETSFEAVIHLLDPPFKVWPFMFSLLSLEKNKAQMLKYSLSCIKTNVSASPYSQNRNWLSRTVMRATILPWYIVNH